jgi:cytochrome c553
VDRILIFAPCLICPLKPDLPRPESALLERSMLDQAWRRTAAIRMSGAGRTAMACRALLAFGVALCTSTVSQAAAMDPAIAGTVHVCASCHGTAGGSTSSTFPRLAGQQKEYLVTQLQAFRDKTRADPHAKTYMWGMAARLSDPTIEGVAAYYAAQPPVAGTPGASPEILVGAKIFAEGVPAAGTPACMGCHGEKAGGNGPIPRLAGQHPAYLARQLEAFASRERANEIMHENSKNLTPEQIGQVTAFLATQ